MTPHESTDQVHLDAGVAKLMPLLSEYGFVFEPGHAAISSGGSFATGFFRKGPFEIGLIVRHGNLGCPNYSEGRGYAGHQDLFRALGREGEAMLVRGKFLSYVAKDGGDAFDALLSDLGRVIIPALLKSEAGFREALVRAHKKFQDELSGKG